MKFIGLNDREYSIQPTLAIRGNASQLHKDAYALLQELFPMDRIYHEIPIKGGPSVMYLDMIVPGHNLAIEVNGAQHTSFNSFHHKDQADFLKAKARDNKKREWMITNNLDFVILEYNEKKLWRDQIVNRHRDESE